MHQEVWRRDYLLIQEMQQSNVSTEACSLTYLVTQLLSRNSMVVRQITEFSHSKKEGLRVQLSEIKSIKQNIILLLVAKIEPTLFYTTSMQNKIHTS